MEKTRLETQTKLLLEAQEQVKKLLLEKAQLEDQVKSLYKLSLSSHNIDVYLANKFIKQTNVFKGYYFTKNQIINAIDIWINTINEKNSLNIKRIFFDKLLSLMTPDDLINDKAFSKEVNNNLENNQIGIILIIKNRTEQTKQFLYYLNKIKQFDKYFHLIIVEDISDNILTKEILEIFEYKYDYYLVNTNCSWSRSRLINFGLLKNKYNLSLIADVDFVFPENICNDLSKLLNNFDFRKYGIAIPVVETNDTFNINNKLVRKKHDFYGHYYILNTQLTIKYGGYDNTVENHGFEERLLWMSMMIQGMEILFMNNDSFKNLFVFHLSHNDNIRGRSRLSEERNNMIMKLINDISLNKYCIDPNLISLKTITN
jgi:hypothetical protein